MIFKRRNNKKSETEDTFWGRTKAVFNGARYPSDAFRDGTDIGDCIPPEKIPGYTEGEAIDDACMVEEGSIIANIARQGQAMAAAFQQKYLAPLKAAAVALGRIEDAENEFETKTAEVEKVQTEVDDARTVYRDLWGTYMLKRWKYWFYLAFTCVVELYIAQWAWAAFTGSVTEQRILSLAVTSILLVGGHVLGIKNADAEADKASRDRVKDTLRRSLWVPLGVAGAVILTTSILRAISFCMTMAIDPWLATFISLAFICISTGVLYSAMMLSRYAHDHDYLKAKRHYQDAHSRLAALKAELKRIEALLAQARDSYNDAWSRIFSLEHVAKAEVGRLMAVAIEHICELRAGYNRRVGCLVFTLATQMPAQLKEVEDELIKAIKPEEQVTTRMEKHYRRMARIRLGQGEPVDVAGGFDDTEEGRSWNNDGADTESFTPARPDPVGAPA